MLKSEIPHTTRARLVYNCVNKPMPIIYFFGTDGSGKSTLAKALTKRLNSHGFKAKLLWMRGTHTLASLLAKLLSKFTIFKGSENPYYGITIPRNLKWLWQLIEFAFILPILLLKFILPRVRLSLFCDCCPFASRLESLNPLTNIVFR